MSKDGHDKIEPLKKVFSNIGERVLIVCIGNELRNDDGVGPYIARGIKNTKFKVIDAGDVLESYIYDIIDYKPSDIIIVDAAFFGGSVGDISIIKEEDISSVRMVSTHTLPLSHLINIIRSELNNELNIKIIGIQVSDTSFGQNISDKVKKTADEIVDYINSV